MKRIIIKYGIGYGSHETDMEVEDDATEEQIEEWVRDCVMERLDWHWVTEGEVA